MRQLRSQLARRGRHARVSIVLGLTLLGAGSAPGCAGDGAAEPSAPINDAASLQPAGETIVVSNAAELVTALSPPSAGKRILLRAGTYALNAPLTVPDGVTLEGEGEMRFDGAGLPQGFGAGAHTTLTMSTNAPGNMLTLGDRVTIRRLEIADLIGRPGNVVAVVSRRVGDRVSASIAESEIVNPNPLGVGPDGPTGYGLLVLTSNANLGGDPAPHQGATLKAGMVRSVIRSPGGGGGLLVFNFAALGSVSVTLSGNIVGGGANGLNANGGVSRPDAVHDSQVRLDSQRNLYRDDSSDPCATPHFGWNLTGGSGPPAPLPVSETARNSLRVNSVDDRIEGFTNGVVATGSRRFFGEPIAGPSTDNSIDLKMLGTRISTPSCGGAQFVRDLDLEGAFAGDDALFPGDGNSLRAVVRGVTGSGPRFNLYANSQGPSGPLPPAVQGDNRLEIVGSPEAFARTNRQITPAPGAQYFTGAVP
jgi:hypothetical protein